MADVLVLAEHTGTRVSKPTLELLTLARRLGAPVAVCPSPLAPPVVDTLARYGATAIYEVDAAWLADKPATG